MAPLVRHHAERVAARGSCRRRLSSHALDTRRRYRSHRSCWLLTVAVFLGTPLFAYSTMLFGHAIAAAWLTIGLWCGLVAARERSGQAASAPRRSRGARARPGSPYRVSGRPARAGHRGRSPLRGAAAPAADRRGTGRGDSRRAAAAAPVCRVRLTIHHRLREAERHSVRDRNVSRHVRNCAAGSRRRAAAARGPVPRAVRLRAGAHCCAAGFAFWPRPLWRRLAPALLGGAALLWLAIAGYTFWQGGPAFGPRHLVPAVPLLGLGLAFWPRRRSWNWCLGALAAASIGVNLVGTATTPFVSEFIPEPLVSVYPRLAAEGALAINPVAFLTPASDVDAHWARPEAYPDASFNLGELTGLHGWASLAPLAMLWALLLLPFRDVKPPPLSA